MFRGREGLGRSSKSLYVVGGGGGEGLGCTGRGRKLLRCKCALMQVCRLGKALKSFMGSVIDY